MQFCKALTWATGIAVLPMLVQAALGKQLCEREVLPFAAMLSTLRGEPGVVVDSETSSTVQLSDAKRMIVWTLSKPMPASVSAYICRRVVQEGNRIVIKMTAECDGTTLDCDALVGRVLLEQNRATEHLRQR